MHFTTIFTASLIFAGSALVQGQDDYNGGYGRTNTGSSQGNDASGEGSQPSMYTKTDLVQKTATAASASSGTSEPESTSTITSTLASVSEGAAAPTGTAGTRVHVVKVGDENGGLVFSPADIKAAKGDMVQFQFYPRVSWTQSSLDLLFADLALLESLCRSVDI